MGLALVRFQHVVCVDAHKKVVPKGLGLAEEFHVAVVEEVGHGVGVNSYHVCYYRYRLSIENSRGRSESSSSVLPMPSSPFWTRKMVMHTSEKGVLAMGETAW